MVLDFLVSLGIFFSGSIFGVVRDDELTLLSNISDYSGYITGCFNDIINYFSGFFRGTPPVEVDVIINGENILGNGENLQGILTDKQVELFDIGLKTITENHLKELKAEISSLKSKGGPVISTGQKIIEYAKCVDQSDISSVVSYTRHCDTSILSEESIKVKVDGIFNKPVSLPERFSLRGFSDKSINSVLNSIYNISSGRHPLCTLSHRGELSKITDRLFVGKNFTFSKDTVKYVNDNLDLFKVYTNLYFRFGMLLEVTDINKAVCSNMKNIFSQSDFQGYVSIFHTVDICMVTYKYLQVTPEVSFRNFVNLYENDEEFKSAVNYMCDSMDKLTKLNKYDRPDNRHTALLAEFFNLILDKLYKKNNTHTEISSLINKGGSVYNTRDDIMYYFNRDCSKTDLNMNISYTRHCDTSILSEESLKVKINEFYDKPAKRVRLSEFCSFKGFPEKRIQSLMRIIYNNSVEQPLYTIFGKSGYSFVDNYLLDGDENFEFTFNDKNTVKYVKENLDIFKSYTNLSFRLGMLLEVRDIHKVNIREGDLADLELFCSVSHTVDVCTALYKSIQEIPKVSIGNFGDLYDNDEEFEKLVDCFDNDLTISDLLDSDKFPGYIGTSIYAELLNSILDKLYTKNNDLS